VIPRFLARQGWTAWHAAAALALAAAGAWLTREAWKDIYHIASTDTEQSHVLLVPVVAAWMFWARRLRLRNCPPGGEYIGPLAVGLGWALSWYGYHHAVQSLWHFGAVLVVLGAVLTVVGKHVLFRFLPAVAVLVFLVPVPGSVRQAVSLPLQSMGAATTHAILETFGVGVERSGNLLTINGINVAVAEACNGMRMVFAVVLVSYAFAFGMPLRNSMRLVVLAASPLAALACNIVRLIPTVLLHGHASPRVAETFHDAAGWLMLPCAFLLLLGVVRVLQWAQVPVNRYSLAYQ